MKKQIQYMKVTCIPMIHGILRIIQVLNKKSLQNRMVPDSSWNDLTFFLNYKHLWHFIINICIKYSLNHVASHWCNIFLKYSLHEWREQTKCAWWIPSFPMAMFLDLWYLLKTGIAPLTAFVLLDLKLFSLFVQVSQKNHKGSFDIWEH